MYTILTFSPWVNDVNVSFYIGYLTITIVASHLLINLFLILRGTFLDLSRKCKLKIAFYNHKKQRKTRIEFLNVTRKMRSKLRVARQKAIMAKNRAPSQRQMAIMEEW